MSPILIVMGVSGSGKSAVASTLSEALGWAYVDGDDLHPAANVAKMRAGRPLDDRDRIPWLAAIAAWIDLRRKSDEPAIVTCSALKRSYRDLLAASRPNAVFVYLKLSIETALRRAEARRGHFLPPSLVPSQFGQLEEPTSDESVLIVDAERSLEAVMHQIESFARNAAAAGG